MPQGTADGHGWRRHQALLERYETGEVDDAGYLREVPQCLPGVSANDVARAFDAWLLGPYPGAGELIDDIKGRGVRTACLSNTNERHWSTLASRDGEYEPIGRLDHLFASHELRVMKPHEAAYRRVEGVTGFCGRQVLFFDDREENVAGARAVGWQAEQVDRVDDAVGQIREILGGYGVL